MGNGSGLPPFPEYDFDSEIPLAPSKALAGFKIMFPFQVPSVYSLDSCEIDSPQTPQPESSQDSTTEGDLSHLLGLQDSGSSRASSPAYSTISTLCEAADPPQPPGRKDEGAPAGASKGDRGLEATPSGEAINSEGLDGATAEEDVGTPAAPATPRRRISTWVRQAFRCSCVPRPEPSPVAEEDGRRRRLGGRLRAWIRKHRGRVHPDLG
ncbi:uncharacterized protein LOC143841972 [Paroedura picta]|uniref:uncharacterized protein LOC143841972 n=1 Tax=Paroedura picta TaxID=143630 RepID=UPI004056EA79